MKVPDKVLVLEDSPMMCSLYRMVLGRTGAELHFAVDGIEGLDLAAQEPAIGLFVVDVNLPRLDGIEFIRRLRGELGMLEAPVLVVSTECSDGDRERAVEAGADGYLCKPWQPEQLMDAIGSLERRAPS